MTGYIFAVVIGVILLGLGLTAFGRRGAPTRTRGPRDNREKPVQLDAPAADEPNPDRSATAPREQVAGAKKHIPPA